MKRSSWILGGLLAAVLGAVAYGQATVVPQVQVIHPTDLIQVIPFGQPSAPSIYATPAQITAQSGYAKVVPLTNAIQTFANSETYLALNPAGTLGQQYFYLAPAPSDGARNCIFSTQTLSAVTVYANTGQSINNAVTSLTANTGVCYLYSASNLTWDRS